MQDGGVVDIQSRFAEEWKHYRSARFRTPEERVQALGRIFGLVDSIYHTHPVDALAEWQVKRAVELRNEISSLMEARVFDRELLKRLENRVEEYARLMFRLHHIIVSAQALR